MKAEPVIHVPEPETGRMRLRIYLPDRHALACLVALVPAVLSSATQGALLLHLGGAMAACLAPAGLFAMIRRRAPGWSWLTTAMLFALLVPSGVPIWQAMAMLALAMVVTEQAFGGQGHGLAHPAAAALALLSLSGPVPEADIAWSTSIVMLPGLVLLLLSGMISWRILAGLAIAFAIASLSGGLPQLLESGPAILLGILAICHPPGSAATRAGRLVQGVLAGGVIALGTSQAPTVGIAHAALVASLFAPLADQAAIAVQQWRGGHLDLD